MEQYKPPNKKDFYFIGLVDNAGNTKITCETPALPISIRMGTGFCFTATDTAEKIYPTGE